MRSQQDNAGGLRHLISLDGLTRDALTAILRTMERVHPDLELLVHAEAFASEPDIAQKMSLCFRQIGAAVVRVSGRSASSFPGGIA